MIRSSFLELAVDVGPAAREHDARTVACASFVRLERVAYDDAVVAADERSKRVGTLVVADPVADDAGRRDAPHLPGLVGLAVEARPARLIETDDRVAERVLEQRRVVTSQPPRDRIHLIPERLRRHVEAVPARIRSCRASGM